MEGQVNLVAIGAILLAAVVHATLQVAPGSLLLLFHASLGKHIKKKTRTIVADYVSGVFILTSLILAGICFALQNCFEGEVQAWMIMVLAGILIALGLCSWLFYYKAGHTTELWIPRAVSRYINARAKKTESNAEGFALGLLTAFAEMPFSLVLMATAAVNVMMIPFYLRAAAVAVYTLIAVMPMLVMRFAIRKGKTVVDVQKWRVKNKNFLRFITGVLFVTLALFVIVFEMIQI